jgi:hypothetical protein
MKGWTPHQIFLIKEFKEKLVYLMSYYILSSEPICKHLFYVHLVPLYNELIFLIVVNSDMYFQP